MLILGVNKILNWLQITSAGRKLIDEVKVVDISEWNSDPELSMYPILPVINSTP